MILLLIYRIKANVKCDEQSALKVKLEQTMMNSEAGQTSETCMLWGIE